MSEPQPTPPPALPLDQLILIALLGALACALVAALVPVEWIAYYALRLWLPIWLLACLVHGGSRVAGRAAWLAKSVRFGRYQFVEFGGGAYAAISVVCFAWLEWAQLRELIQWIIEIDWFNNESAVREFAQSIAHNVTGFFIGSFMNGLYAFIWPAFWKKVFSVGNQWPAIVAAWALYEAATWTLRRVAARVW